MLNRLRFTPAWQGAIERREQAGFDVAAGAVSGFLLTAQAAGSSDNARPRQKSALAVR